MASEIQKKMTFDTLRYSMVWEDIELLYNGFNITSDDIVLSITSAGDNVLNLLLKEPRAITAIDLNAAQNALLELKMAAISYLEWGEFMELIGAAHSARRLSLYERVRKYLPAQAQNYWDNQSVVIDDGVIVQGRLEKYIRTFYKDVLPGLLSTEAVPDLLSLNDPAMQKIFYEKTWETPAFLEAFQKYFGRENMAEHGRDSAQFDYVNTEPGRHFAERFKYVCTQLPARHNFYLHRFLSDSYGPSLPPYLQKENFERLRKLVSRVTPVTNSIEDHLRSSKQFYTKANLSDMFEYMSETNMAHVLETMHEAFRPGGRIAYWCLLVPRPLPFTLSKNYLSHNDLAKNLWKQDRSWFYRDFHILERI